MDSFPSTRRLEAHETSKFCVDSRMTEVHLEEWLHQVCGHPNIVYGERSAIDESQSPEVKERRIRIKSKSMRLFGVDDSIKCEDLTVLAITLILDRSKEAVKRSDLLF